MFNPTVLEKAGCFLNTLPASKTEMLNFLAQLGEDPQACGYAFTIKPVYSFAQLSEAARLNVLANHQTINVDHDWWYAIYADWHDRLALRGFNDVAIQFSGFDSRGDGASFTAQLDLAVYLKAHKLGRRYRRVRLAAKKGEIRAEIYRHTARYVHEYTVTLQYDYFGHCEKTRQQLENLADDVLATVRNYSRDIYHNLATEYDYTAYQ